MSIDSIGAPGTTRSPWDDLPAITTVDQLHAIGVPAPAIRDKVRPALHPLDLRWIAASPLLFLATASLDGRVDVSPKGDPPGFVKVLDGRTLAVPERSGNRRFDGYHNLLENPHVGLNFVIPGRGDTLRVNGAARLVTDGPFFADMVVKGHRPLLVLLVTVEEVFYHCAKAFLRAQAWQPESWNPDAVPRNAAIARELLATDQSLAEIEEYYSKVYTAGLYPTEDS